MMLSAYAQKSYVNVYVPKMYRGSSVRLSGNLPEGVDRTYTFGYDYSFQHIGEVLNILAEKGYTVEHMTQSAFGDDITVNYLLSSSTSSPQTKIRTVKSEDDREVTEIVRYNLQGLPVNASEKGLQIIVYSNYTTKTVFVE